MYYESYAHRFADVILNSDYEVKKEIEEAVQSIDFIAAEKRFEAENGKEAAKLAKEEDPQIILLDIDMPVVDGIEACKRLKAERETSSISVIMMTGHAYSKAEAIEAGADEFINKPFDLVELSFRLKSILRVRYLTDEVDRLVAHIEELQQNRPMP